MRLLASLALAVTLVLPFAPAAHAVQISCGGGDAPGACSGTLTYTPGGAGTGTLTFNLNNDGAPFLTDLVFNNPGNTITGITDSQIQLRELIQDAVGDWTERQSTLQLQEVGGGR